MGALDSNYAYKANLISADRRGTTKAPAAGLMRCPLPANRLACRTSSNHGCGGICRISHRIRSR